MSLDESGPMNFQDPQWGRLQLLALESDVDRQMRCCRRCRCCREDPDLALLDSPSCG